MPTPADPLFERYELGEIRDQILNAFRKSLSEIPDPKTGQPWSEDVIRTATMQGSRFWVEAEAIDLIGQSFQRRGDFLATQVDPRRASTAFLENFHGPAAKLPRLEATGGSGQVTAPGVPGTVFVGSTTIPNTLATQAHDAAGRRYQVLESATIPSGSGSAVLTLQAVDTGRVTNLEPLSGGMPTELTWINRPSGAAPSCTVGAGASPEAFRGGTDRETDQEWGERLFDARGSRPRAGNPAHFRLWARQASNAVADAFVYPCALHAGSVVVAITQKRGGSVAHDARIPTPQVMKVVTGYLTPPTSPLVPPRAHVVVVAPVEERTNSVVTIGMAKESVGGWADPSPWPTLGAQPATITSVTDQTHFVVTAATPPPIGSPRIMVWWPEIGAFEELKVECVASNGAVALTEAPSRTLTPGHYIAPYTTRASAVARGVIAHFDSLGPGEVVSAGDPLAERAYRRPRPITAATYTAGSGLAVFIMEALGGLVPTTVRSISKVTPSVPATASEGPRLLLPWHFACYPE